ncbi:ABC transporter ATP-binding protein [Liquorilactobacillus hordei]|uniref:Multidrug ABC superfamily ATP binding cassette transporter, ABC protein n=1 Tax=Liquorilactobacillus hordei DSM 19519 TaxID=1423759 RepID=A0A0R1MEQ3_9LACO|nr:ABC transporter ATP-binding protein [Liquorilactobacillus hordei]KRL06337.1 multidrug ABC superfamily ATP binding cassette transporter, ABC protein [Liquorilactobacillus hordei DSM 19519]QYH51465.1 ABC transporter ATP-binding protein [Liquorilactobacillus hordei DSM 19519]
MLVPIRHLLYYLKYYKKQFIIGTGLLLLASSLELYSPMIAKQLIDQVMTPAAKNGNLKIELLLILLSIYLGLNIFGALFRYISLLLLRKMSNKIVQIMRHQLFNHMHKLPISYFDNIPSGKVVARITNDTEVLRSNFYVNVISNLLSNIIQVVGAYIALVYLNKTLSLYLLLLVPIMFFWQKFYTKYASKYNLAMREYISQISGQLNEFVQGIAIIQAFQKEKQLLEEFKKTVDKWVKVGRKALLLDTGIAWGFATLLRNLTILLMLVTLSWLFLDNTLAISAGLLYVLIDYINRLFDPIDGFVQTIANIQQSLAAGQRIFEFTDEKTESVQTKNISIKKGAISFNNVSFGYLPDQQILNSINFHVDPGETLALVGHTGSGKSSILNLLFRFYDPQKGNITVDNQVISDYNRYSVRKSMAIVMQDPYLFTGTIASNISMNRQGISDAMCINALKQVGAEYLLNRYPDGINHPVVEKGTEFSSGERQLISFARALVSNPKILILDEATSHVDTETETLIQKAMGILKKGRTTFIIAHRLSTIKDSNQILVLEKGKIVERGSHESLIQKNGIYHQMYQMQSEQL